MVWLDELSDRLQIAAEGRNRDYRTPAERLAKDMSAQLAAEEFVGGFAVASRQPATPNTLSALLEPYRKAKSGPVFWVAFGVTGTEAVEFDLKDGVLGGQRRRIPASEVGPVTGTWPYHIEVGGRQWWVPVWMLDEARRLHRAATASTGKSDRETKPRSKG